VFDATASEQVRERLNRLDAIREFEAIQFTENRLEALEQAAAPRASA